MPYVFAFPTQKSDVFFQSRHLFGRLQAHKSLMAQLRNKNVYIFILNTPNVLKYKF